MCDAWKHEEIDAENLQRNEEKEPIAAIEDGIGKRREEKKDPSKNEEDR